MNIIYKETPMFYVSKITGNKYDYELYSNHGRGRVYRDKIDLPLDEYPYGIEFEKEPSCKWMV